MNVSACITEIDAVTKDFESRFKTLKHQELNFKPNTSTWSIGQNMEHLIHVTESYFPTFKEIIDGNYQKPGVAKLPFWAKLCGKMILKSVEPTRAKKIKTFNIWEPSVSDVPATILESFKDSQSILLDHIRAMTAYFDQNTIIASPANKNIVYTLDVAIEIIIEHQKRHLNQAMEVLHSMNHKQG